MGAVALVARSELRRRRGAALVLVLMVGLISGVVLTATAGARRTSSVLDRFLEATGEPEASVGLVRPRVASDTDLVLELAAELEALEGAGEVTPTQGIIAVAETEEDFLLITGPDDRYLHVATPHLLQGRMPSSASEEEVALNEAAAQELGLVTGDRLVVPTIRPETGEAMFNGEVDRLIADGPVLDFTVVGVYRHTASFDVSRGPQGIVSPATESTLGDAAAFSAIFHFAGGGEGRGEGIDLDEAAKLLAEAAPDGEVFAVRLSAEVAPVRTAFNSIAAGLTLFAAVALIAGLMALGQVVSRQVALSDQIIHTSRSLGMSRAQISIATALPAAGAALVGVVLGLAMALLLSPRFPISVARRAEVDPGIRPDWPALALGSLFILGAVTAWAASTAWRQARPAAGKAMVKGSARLPRLRRSVSVTAGLGLSTVLGPRGERSVRAGAAVLGAVVGIAGVLGIAVFTTSQRTATEESARYGWTWDASPDLYAEEPLAIVEALVEDPRIAAVGGAFSAPMAVEGQLTSGGALIVAGGSLQLTYLDGRAPQSPDEAALGKETMSDLGVGIGDTVAVEGPEGATASLMVVGEVVVPTESDDPGNGIVFTPEGFQDLAGEFFEQRLLLVYPPGTDQTEIATALEADYPVEFSSYSYPIPPETLSQFDRMRPTLLALAIFMGLLGVIGLLHFLLLSTRRRGSDVAVLKAMGFVRRQVRGVVIWQAATVAILGVVIGVPLGMIVGRWAWVAAVDQIGIVDTPTMPWAVGAVVALVAVSGAAALALIPGWWAARRSPADGLRAE